MAYLMMKSSVLFSPHHSFFNDFSLLSSRTYFKIISKNVDQYKLFNKNNLQSYKNDYKLLTHFPLIIPIIMAKLAQCKAFDNVLQFLSNIL